MNDRNFDDLFHRLIRRLYQRQGGEIRLNTLWKDLSTTIPQIEEGGLTVLDAGGGLGQFSVILAEKGHRVTYIDLSENMKKKAEELAESKGLRGAMTFLHGPFQELGEVHFGSYDLVLSHGVIAWLASPKDAIPALRKYIKPGGYLSLLFYNVDRLIIKKGAAGQFRHILNDTWKKSKKDKSLTPTHPLKQSDVRAWIEEEHLFVVSKAGIRIFEGLYRGVDFSDRMKELEEAEWKFCKEEPYSSMAQHIHFICRKMISF